MTTSCIQIDLNSYVMLLWILIAVPPTVTAQDPSQPGRLKRVSQCYRDGGFAFVSLYCGANRVIQIQRAFHGSHWNQEIEHCGELANDCTEDALHVYDWTACEGRSSCVRMLEAQKIPDGAECKGTHMLYLQVHYTCIEASQMTSTELPSTDTKMDTTALSTSEEVHSICTNYTNNKMEELQVSSPGYPMFYPSGTECRCLIKAQPKTKVKVTYTDLALLMRANQCVDWLLLQSLGFKNSAAVTCGQMASGQEKTLTAKGHWLLLHFHTAKTQADGDSKRMKGFKVRIQSEPEGAMDVQCFRTSTTVLASLQQHNGKQDARDNILLPQSDLNAIAKQSTAQSSSFHIRPFHSTTLTLFFAIFMATIVIC